MPTFPVTTAQVLERFTTAGLKYYVNSRTNETHWSPPDSAASTGFDESRSSALSGRGQVSRLPPGWERRVTTNGREYYVNHDRRSGLREPLYLSWVIMIL